MKATLATGLVITAASALAVGLMLPLPTNGKAKPPRPDVARLQILAEEACLCDQRGQSADCRKPYTQAIAAYKVQDVASACAPISTSADIIEYDGQEFWITTEYGVVANLPKGMSAKLCRKADAQAVEAAYAEAFGPPIDWNKPISDAELQAKDRAANAALVKALEAIHRGERPSSKRNSGGCA